MTSQEDLVALFSATAAHDADGYATGFHAGVAAVQRTIARDLLAIRHDPIRLRAALLDMACQPNGPDPALPVELVECHPAHGKRVVI